MQPLVAQTGELKNSHQKCEILTGGRKPIGVATYQIVKRLPKELKGQLPGPEEIAKLLDGGN